MEELMIKIDNVTKQYKLGQIGGTTLRDELQRLSARIHHKEDPTKRIGAKDYNKGETFMALNGVSFEVKKGERVGIIGHNGAGKSTLLKLLSRVTAPTSGEIGLNGRVASMLEVGTGFHGELTGRENIYMNGAILGMTKKEIESKIEDIIEFSECRQFIDTPVKRYSSGMYVKLAFSVAAHLDSEIMIMDEVLAVGDMAFQKKCLDKMNDVSRQDGRTILYVSHNMNTIRQLCDRVVVLDHGTVVYDGDVEPGIDVYLGLKRSFNSVIDLKSAARERYLAYRAVTMTKLSVETEECVYNMGEKIKGHLTASSSQKYDNVRMSVFLSCDGITVVSMRSDLRIDLSASDDNHIDFEFGLQNLAPGNYSMKITLAIHSDLYNSQILDSVSDCFAFEIKTPDNFQVNKWRTNIHGFFVGDYLKINNSSEETRAEHLK